ncbi:MAG: DUF6334 family protein [Bryobacteraceae bacterium]
MIQRIAVPVAEALHPTLSVFHAISQESLRAVRVENDLDRVIFDFDRGALVVEGNPDDDSIEIQFVNQGEFQNTEAVETSHLDPWARFIGKPFGWGWVTVNQQGYCDGLLLSFGGIDPQLLLTVAASALVVSTITRHEFTKST